MKVYSNCAGQKPLLTIVCCIHGDERFGLDVLSDYRARLSRYPGLKLILANERAVKVHTRYIHHDLNRIFLKKPTRSYEGSLVDTLKKEIKDSRYLLDIHTTSSAITMTPIITSLNTGVRRMLNLFSSKEIAYMQNTFSRNSLIGQVVCGVSAEFNEKYARTNNARIDVYRIANGLFTGTVRIPRKRTIFYIDSVISKQKNIASDTRNFMYMRSLKVYPFLLHERAYTDFHAFGATRIKRIKI